MAQVAKVLDNHTIHLTVNLQAFFQQNWFFRM